jgi:hypothetical protein
MALWERLHWAFKTTCFRDENFFYKLQPINQHHQQSVDIAYSRAK